MANFVYNFALGRVAEFHHRVKNNDPANSVLVIVVLSATGIETDAVLKDKDSLSAVLSGATDEVVTSGYARKVLSDSDIVAISIDDTNDRTDLDLPDQTWTAVSSGGSWSDIVICYDGDSTAGTDANIIPLTQHDFVVSTDGSDITLQFAAAGYFRAQQQ